MSKYEQKNRLDSLEKKLYSREVNQTENNNRSQFKNRIPEIEDVEEIVSDWQKDDKNNFDVIASKVTNMATRKHGFLSKFFIFSIIFFVVALGIAVFVFMGGMNFVSSRNVDIRVVGPISVGGGQEVSFDVGIVNNNNIRLDSASLLIEYPEGTRSPKDLNVVLTRERFELDPIRSGGTYNHKIEAVFFGEKDTVKEVKISLEYRVENSSALFYKEKNYEITISSAPVIVTPIYPKEVNANQEIIFEIEVASNSSDNIGELLLTAEYPFGFNFLSSSPSPSFSDNIWRFTNLKSGEKRNIKITGSISGQDNEERVFRITTGTPSEDDERMIGVVINELAESILIRKPFLGLDVLINGIRGDYSASGGSQVNTEFVVQNNLSSKIFNVKATARLVGGALNKQSISVPSGGFYSSSNDTILWDNRSVSKFSEMNPGETQNLSFRMSPLTYGNILSGSRPEIDIEIVIEAERISDSGRSEIITSKETRKIILATDLRLFSRTFRSQGNIENFGHIPPKADNKTTYNILWNIENSFNQVSNLEARAVLPPYVRWTGFFSPDNESISFDSNTNEVIWRVGGVLPNTGFDSSKKEVYFQIELMPSLSQVGQSPVLVGEVSVTGIDRNTNNRIQFKVPAVTTSYSSDPTFKQGNERVVQ